MKQEILVRLKTAEEETARRIEKGRERAVKIVKESRGEADEIVRASQEQAQRDQEAQVAAERGRLDGERERVLAEGRAREGKVRARYEAEAGPFVKKAVEALARSLDA